MKLQKLTLQGFRSWEGVTFEFPPGVTALLGANGSGKSSIRLGAQYAVSGSLSKLPKKLLVKDTGEAPFLVQLEIEDDRGRTCIIRRASTRTTVSVDGVDYSVREATYLARLRDSFKYAFLSPDNLAFVDAKDFQRKEMLYELIPEVDILRAACTPRIKEAHKRTSGKRINIAQNIATMQSVNAEVQSSIGRARAAHERELARIEALKAATAAQLPFTAHEYNKKRESAQDMLAEKKKYVEYMGHLRRWIDSVEYNNASNVRLINEKTQIVSDISRFQDLKDALEQAMGDMSQPVVCPGCSAALKCAACGTDIVNVASTMQQQIRKISEYDGTIAALKNSLATKDRAIAEAKMVDPQAIAAELERFNAATGYVQTIDANLAELNADIRSWEIADRNIQEVNKASLDTSTILALEEEVKRLEETVARSKQLISVKEKTLEVLCKLERTLTMAADATYTTLPALFFDNFLTRLSTYCNVLLAEISDLTVSMSATDNGISIMVGNRQFEQLSSGERQRVRIATTLAFSLLSRESDTLFLDEVFDSAIDHAGKEDAARMINNVLRKHYTKIIVVSHEAFFTTELQPDNVIVVERDETGTSRFVRGVEQ